MANAAREPDVGARVRCCGVEMEGWEVKKPKRKVGRPAKVTLDMMAAIAEDIAFGLTEEQACFGRVNLETFRSAKRRDEFSQPIKEAQSKFLRRAVRAIAEGGEHQVIGEGEKATVIRKPWQGMAWLLERRYKPQFNRTEQVAQTDAEGRAIFTPQDFKDLEEIGKELVREMEKKEKK